MGISVVTTNGNIFTKHPEHAVRFVRRELFIFSLIAGCVGASTVFADKIDVSAEINKLKTAETAGKVSALAKLGKSGDKKAASALIDGLKQEKNAFVRARIASTLADTGDKAAIGELLSVLLNDSSPEVRYAAAYSLTYLRNDSALTVLIGVFQNEEEMPGLRMRCANALTYYFPSERVLNVFIAALENPNPAIRLQAVTSLGFYPDADAVTMSLKRVSENDKDDAVRASAKERLEVLGVKTP